MSNTTYIKILQAIENFASQHLQIKKFASDFPTQIPNFGNSDEQYPILFVSPTNSIFNDNTNTFDIKVFCFDIIKKDRSNINTILSDTNSVLNDLNLWLSNGDLAGIDLEQSTEAIPINNALLDYAAGWEMTVRLTVDAATICDIPFNNVPLVIDVCNNISYPAYLTCIGLDSCPTITGITSDIANLKNKPDIFVTGGTYSNGIATYINNSGGTFSINGFSTGTSSTDTYVTGGTYSNGTAIFTNNTGGTFNVSGFSTSTGGGSGTVSGSGTTNYIPKWSGATGMSNSQIYDTGTFVGINTIAPVTRLSVVPTGSQGYPVLGTATGQFSIMGDTNLYGLFIGTNTTTGFGFLQSMRKDSATAYSLVLQPVGGNVLIGTTTNTTGFTLQVSGDTLINGITIGRGTNNLNTNVIVGSAGVGGGGGLGRSTALGQGAAANINAATDQTAIGYNAIGLNQNGTTNVGLGSYAGYYTNNKSTGLSTISSSTFIGYRTSALNNSDVNEIVIGYDANGLGSNTVVLGNDNIITTALKGNVLIGTTATTGTNKLQVSSDALINSLTIGKGGGNQSNNTALGINTLAVNTTGQVNVAVGYFSLAQISTGGNNVGIGAQVMDSSTTSNSNVGIGYRALRGITSNCNFNIGIGENSGTYFPDGLTPNTATTSSIFIGTNTRTFANNNSNQIVIGHAANGIGTNTIVLGNDSVITTALKGNVIIGQTGTIIDNGVDKLQVNGTINAIGYKVSGGTQTQFQMADGSLSSIDVYVPTTAYTITNNNSRYIVTATTPTIITVSSGITDNITVLQYGIGQVSFTAGTGTILRNASFTQPIISEQYASAALSKLVNAGEIRLYGELASI